MDFDKLVNICKDLFNHDVLIVISFFAVIIISYLLSFVFARIFVRITSNITKKTDIKKSKQYRAFKLLIRFLGIYVAIYMLSIPVNISIIVYKIFKCLLILIIANTVSSMFSVDSKIFNFITARTQIKANKALVRFIGKIINTFIYIIATFIVITELGYNLNGIIAGVGVGSAVLALAAQDIFKSIFGSIVILIDRPFIIGDYIETDEYKGTVEDITFRSTRIRTLDNSIAIIQNSKMAEASILNWNKLNGTRRVKINLGITLNTDPKKMMHFMYNLKKELESHDCIKENSVEVHFDEIKSDCYNILIYLYVKASNYVEFLNNQDSVNFKVISIVKKEKIDLAYPTQTIVLDKE